MITITILQNQEQYVGVELSGHAAFAEAGNDIVCAAVSVLAINTINGIAEYTEDAIVLETPEKSSDDNRIYFRLTEDVSEASDVLMKTLVLGLREINKQYGDSYLTLNFKEV